MYATTNIQLFKQMKELGYSDNDLKLMYNSYEVAKELCSCLHRPSGNTHLSHLIGTASILAKLKVPVEISAAGLLHSLYSHGEFGDGEHKIKRFKRQYIKKRLGHKIEEYVAGYAALKWFGDDVISDINKNMDNFSSFEKEVILIRIADALDEFNDYGNLYVSNPDGRIEYFEKVTPAIKEISNKIGYPALGKELEKRLAEHKEIKIPKFLRNSENKVFMIPPMNCRKRMDIYVIHLFRKIKRKLKRIRIIISRKFGLN